MSDETPKLKVTMIPAARQSLKKVAIYCRVSTTHESQDESLDECIDNPVPLTHFDVLRFWGLVREQERCFLDFGGVV